MKESKMQESRIHADEDNTGKVLKRIAPWNRRKAPIKEVYRVWFWDGTYTVVSGYDWYDARSNLEETAIGILRAEKI